MNRERDKKKKINDTFLSIINLIFTIHFSFAIETRLSLEKIYMSLSFSIVF